MAGLMDIAGDAVNAGFGKASKTTLQSFLDKFSNPAGRYVDTIDPLGLFEVRFVFQPGKKPSSNEGFDWSRVGNSLLNSAKTAGMNMLDSATGGLASSLINDFGGKSVDEQRTEFMKKSGGKRSFLEYLVPANMLTSGE